MTERTPLGAIDSHAVTAFWKRFLAQSGHADSKPPAAWAFGDSVELADELIALVLHGPKRATACSLAQYEHTGEQIPEVGDCEIVTDGSMRPRAVLQFTDMRVGPLSSVDDAFAWDEGEGDRSRSYWLDAHTRVFKRFLASVDQTFDPDMMTSFERFDVIYQE